MSSYALRPATIEDMTACAAILNDWIDETPWMPRVHDHRDVERHYRETVFVEHAVTVADMSGAVVAFSAVSEDAYVTALYVEATARGHGLGRALLDKAKAARPSGLKLWTFQANRAARHFYEREEFSELRRTGGDNEECLPDILYAWVPGERHAA
ncbi:GNAT family N-acetyltransferase [Martelella mediterranea]|uniref:GNAT family N-acetyltransferase n=1 Tax=Martelella mediterranea TaxID=293089 RepID=UPI001E6334B9|nr:GNAT family N-acetyltransferase [Martelella mediterranea]MCD1633809.1 GNAT family N-acetyltransferase [Martelella mediterranea]